MKKFLIGLMMLGLCLPMLTLAERPDPRDPNHYWPPHPLAGKFALQVEDGGRLWYITPDRREVGASLRYEFFFDTMLRELEEMAMVVSREQAESIPLALEGVSKERDRDGDGISDYDEVKNDSNPFGYGEIGYDEEFSIPYTGFFINNVQDGGVISYVDPLGERWELTESNLREQMIRLAVGASNKTLEQLPIADDGERIELSSDFLEDNGVPIMRQTVYHYSNPRQGIFEQVTMVPDCYGKYCFERRFASCLPETRTYMDGVTHHFVQIIGPTAEGQCEVMIADINPFSFDIEPDICTFDPINTFVENYFGYGADGGAVRASSLCRPMSEEYAGVYEELFAIWLYLTSLLQ